MKEESNSNFFAGRQKPANVDQSGTIDATVEQRIRARGPVLDMPFTQSIYMPLLQNQRRDGVQVDRDLSYGDDACHRLDLYRPQSSSGSASPIMVFMHGGGFVRGDKSDRENIGQHFARQGIVVAVPNYRLAPTHCWPSGAEDVVSVYGWLRRNAGQFDADPARIVLAGESAGAAHVATATLVRRFHPDKGLSIAGAILISGVYNVELEKLARRQFDVATPDPRNEAYFGSDFAVYRKMSTVRLIDAPAAPLLITYAELDLLQMQVQAGELFARLVADHGFNPELRVIRGHNHLSQTYAVNTGDETLSAPVLEFIQSCQAVA